MKQSSPLFLQTMGVLWVQLMVITLTIVLTKRSRPMTGLSFFALIILQFLLIVGIFHYASSFPISLVLFTLFSILNGILLSPAYRSMSRRHIIMALASTAVIFVLMTLYAIAAYHSGFMIIGWSGYLQFALLALFFGLLLNIGLSFVGYHYEIFQQILSIAGIILFSIYIVYDIQILKKASSTRKNQQNPVIFALSLFLDILNLFNFVSASS